MPGSPIQEQIRAWIRICGRRVAYLEKSQKNETSRPTFASSNLEKPPKGGFFFDSSTVKVRAASGGAKRQSHPLRQKTETGPVMAPASVLTDSSLRFRAQFEECSWSISA